MYANRDFLYAYNMDFILSRFKDLCCFGSQEEFDNFKVKTTQFLHVVDTDSVVHGAILAIHHNNIAALN